MGETFRRVIAALPRLFREAVLGRLWTRREAAYLLPGLTASLLLLLSFLDLDWERRSIAARIAARLAEDRGVYASAAILYRAALADQPYDWESRLALADIQYRHDRDTSPVLGNYLIALAGTPEEYARADTAGKMRILRLFRSGALEDPADAVDDMFLAVEAGARRAFIRRLAPELLADAGAYWKGWRERGRGRMVSRRIFENGDGSYDAIVELAFLDGSQMSVRLAGTESGAWRLAYGFP
jgi:hypothetical protein